jgi:hypothetical protein
MINGVLWRTRTGAPWRDVPSSYGNWKGVYSRHRRWSGDGTWELILDRLRTECDGDGSEWTVGVDSSVVRAHQHAAGPRHQPPKDIPEDEQAGVAVVRRACDAPCRQIAENAGQDASTILGRIRQRKGAHGYNAARDTFENLIEAGGVDPTMVVRLALQHAASIAGLLLSSEALIADVREPHDYPENGGPNEALSAEPILSHRDRRPIGGRSI